MKKHTPKNNPTLLTIPTDKEVFESPTSIYWFDDDGILFSISKWSEPVPIEEGMKVIDEFLDKHGHKKYRMIIDITNSAPSDKQGREIAAEVFPKITTAMAVLSNTPLGNMMANLFIGLKPPSYPMKIFSNPEKAVEWIKRF